MSDCKDCKSFDSFEHMAGELKLQYCKLTNDKILGLYEKFRRVFR